MDKPVLADQQDLCTDIGCSLENLPEVMDDRDGWRERESEKSVLAARLDDDDDQLLKISFTYKKFIWFHLKPPSFKKCCLS